MIRVGRRRGFTLVELLVVIAIIGVLVALLTPGLVSAWAVVSQTRCATNLRFLGQAFGVRASDERMGIVGGLNATNWPAQLLKYVEDDENSLLCPDGGLGVVGGASPSTAVDLTDHLFLRTAKGSTIYETELAEGPMVLKFSETQYNDAKSRGLLGNADSANYIRTKYDCSYKPDHNPDSFWFCFEDYGGDDDFKDVMIRVQDKRDGSVTLSIVSGFTGHRNSVHARPGGKELVHVASNTTNPLILSVYGQGATTSYGMNAYAVGIAEGAKRILLLDYSHYLAKVQDVWTDKTVDTNGDGVPDFARHKGMINVLFTDGSIEALDPQTINPASLSVELMYWNPENVGR